MRRVDYNKIMCALGIVFTTMFCAILVKDYTSYDMLNNSTPFYSIILVRIIEFLLPGWILILLYNANTKLKENDYVIKSEKLPVSFSGYKIAHISDFHNTNSKRIKNKIIELLNKNNPDIIVITGDLIDSRRTNIWTVKQFLNDIINIAPVYYVLGNHESRLRDIQILINEVQSRGVNILRNITVDITRNGENIKIIGLDDPAFFIPVENSYEIITKTDKYLQTIVKKDNKFSILLTHRPELVTLYAKYNFDIVFTGHAHGGQIRLPILGGVIAPGQGLFPKYTKGVYKQSNTTMILSGGVGNSKFPFRINNRPEIIFATLTNK